MRRQHLGHRIQHRPRHGLFLCDEHQAAAHIDLYRNQPVTRFVEVRKAVLVGDVFEPTVEAIGPTMVGALEHTAGTAAHGNLFASMPAGVTKRAYLPVFCAHGYDRRAARDMGHVGAGFRQSRKGTEGQRQMPHQSLLLREAFGTAVVINRLQPVFVPHVRRAAIDVIEEPLYQFLVVSHRDLADRCRHRA